MDNATANLLATLLVAVVTTALPLVAAFAAQRYRAWYDRQPAQQQQIIDMCIRIAVYAAEQLGRTGVVQNKKVAALRSADEHLRDHGITLPLAAIDDRIEALVFEDFHRWQVAGEPPAAALPGEPPVEPAAAPPAPAPAS